MHIATDAAAFAGIAAVAFWAWLRNRKNSVSGWLGEAMPISLGCAARLQEVGFALAMGPFGTNAILV